MARNLDSCDIMWIYQPEFNLHVVQATSFNILVEQCGRKQRGCGKMRVSWSGGFGSSDVGGRMGSKNIKK